jgi:hypothetical protein
MTQDTITRRQAILDRVVAHAYKQRHPAMSKTGTCRYRTEDGLSACFLGALIPDERYMPEMEGKTAGMLRDYGLLGAIGAQLDDTQFLNRLQECHDDAAAAEYKGEEWLREALVNLRKVAGKYNLTVPKENP